MLAWIKRFFASPVFADEEETRVAALLNTTINTVLIATAGLPLILAIASPGFMGEIFNVIAVGVMLAATLGLRFLMRRGNIQLTSILLSSALWALAAFSSRDGVRSANTTAYLLPIILAGLLLGGRAAIIFAALSIVWTGVTWYADVANLIAFERTSVGVYDLVAYSTSFIVAALLLRHAANSINRGMERARRNEMAQIEANRELQKIRASLEERVAERTHNLERRTAQLRAATEVGRTVTAVLEIDRLVQQVVELIRERFALYDVALFLVDDTGKWAILRAGSGETRQGIPAHDYRLPINDDSLVCRSIIHAEARVADEGSKKDTARLSILELPDTRSKAALPLHSRGQVIGALLVQSKQLAIFDQDTLAILQTVTDQVAVALDNAHLFTQSREALEATRRAYGELGRRAWTDLAHARPDLRLRKDEHGISPAGDAWGPEMEAALQTGKIMPQQDNPAALAVPIKVRGQVIGVINARKPEEKDAWMPEEVALLETLTEQLGVAMDGARLYQTTQRRAAREQLVAEVTTRIRESLDVETVLKIAASEMRQALNLDDLVVRLATPETGDESA